MAGRKILMATKAYHPGTKSDLSRDEPDLCIVSRETTTRYIGSWVTGYGFMSVEFPKDTTRELTDDEKAEWRGKQVVGPGGYRQDVAVDYEMPLEKIGEE